MSVGAAKVLRPDGGKTGLLGSIGVRFMVSGAEWAGGFSLVEHPMPPRKLAAPMHRHRTLRRFSPMAGFETTVPAPLTTER